MSKQILVERKDINLANRMEDKLPREYVTFRDSIVKTLEQHNELNCRTYIPQLYNLLKQSEFEPNQARAVVLKDGTELFHWSPITILQVIPSEAKNHVKAEAGRKSAEIKKVRKRAREIVNAALDETRRGPGRPRNPEQVFTVTKDVDEFLAEFKPLAEQAKKGTNRITFGINASGTKLLMSVDMVEATVSA